MNKWLSVGLVTALGVAGVLWLSGKGLEARVRECLENNSGQYFGGQDHVYLTKVTNEKVWRRYPDGTATRFISYQVRGSTEIKSTTCLW